MTDQSADPPAVSAVSPTGNRSRRRRPGALPVIVAALVGASLGIGGFTFNYAEGLSYLSNDPRACVNCHVMQSQYDGWLNASHHANAVCNDCHVPHDSLAHKYLVKAEHGYRHSKGFTFNDFHEPIQMKASSRRVVVENCLRCHAGIGADTSVHTLSLAGEPVTESADCLHCHARVGHGPTR